MAGYTDAAFRLLTREFGADVVISELISADAIAHAKLEVERQKTKVGGKELIFNRVISTKNQPTCDLLSFFEAERPMVIQLFGKHPENFAKATKWITNNLKPDGIDINMGCPARKVIGSDHGAALLKYPDLAAEIVRAVRENTDLPVSVKTRLGWDDPDTILEFAPVLYEARLTPGQAGIDAIIIHGRTYKQAFKGTADWTNIYKVKEMLPNLTVIGNGDLKSTVISTPQFGGEKSHVRKDPRASRQIGLAQDDKGIELDGYAIGRATFGKPWLFSRDEVSQAELADVIMRHAELVAAAKGKHGLVEFRKHLLKYLFGFDGAKSLRKEAVAIQSLEDVAKILTKF